MSNSFFTKDFGQCEGKYFDYAFFLKTLSSLAVKLSNHRLRRPPFQKRKTPFLVRPAYLIFYFRSFTRRLRQFFSKLFDFQDSPALNNPSMQKPTDSDAQKQKKKGYQFGFAPPFVNREVMASSLNPFLRAERMMPLTSAAPPGS